MDKLKRQGTVYTRAAELRRRAEQIARSKAAQSSEVLEALSLEETRRTLHELRVQQIELEMQNEELLRAGQELETSRARYFDLYDLAPFGYLTLSEKGLILEVNLFAAGLLGLKRTALVRQPFSRFIRLEDQDIFYRTRRRLIETEAQQACELRMVKKDETTFLTRLAATVAQDADGFPVYRLVLSDITDRKRAEEALQQAHDELEERVAARTKELRLSEKRYRQLFDSMNEGFLLIEMIPDESGNPVSFRYLDANPALERLTHLKRQGIVGKEVREVLPEIEPYWIETFGRVAMTGEPVHFEQFSKDLNGWYDVSVYRPEPGKAAVVYRNVSERRQMEAALRENETMLRGILNSVMESIWVFNAEGRVLLANDTTFSRLSRPPDEVIGHRMVEILPDDLARFRMGWLQEVFESARPAEFEDVREGIFFRHTFYPILDETGVVTAVVSFSRDITQSRRMEMALRRNQEDLARAQEVGHTGSWRMDVTCNELTWSDENYRIFGIPKGTPLNYETFLEIVHPGDRQYVDTQWQAALGGAPYHIEHRIVADGKVKWVRERAYLEFDQAGSLLGGFGITQDITERKQFDLALKESEERYRRLIEGAPVAVYVNRADHVALVNQACLKLFGATTPEQLLGKSIYELFPPDFHLRVSQRIQQMREKGEVTPTMEAKINRLDGTLLEVEIHASPFQDQGLNGIHVVLLDVSGKKQAEETLRRDEARFRLLATTAGALLASPSPQRAVEELCTRVMEHLDCQVFFNFLVDESRGHLHLNAFAGIREEEAQKIEWLDYGVAVCGCVARDQQRIVAEDIFHQPDIRTDLVRSFGVQAYACHPLLAQGRLLGTLSFGTKTRSSFSPQDLELMKTVTDQVTTAMERIRLLEMIQAGRDELEQRVQERTGELKKANARLAEQSRILESFFKDTITPLVLLDQDFNFIRVNEAYARTCQRPVADFPGHNHFEFYPHEENEAIFREVVKTGTPYQAVAKPFSFPDHPEWGVTYWDWILTPLMDERGETAFLVFSLEEVTDRQMAEEALRLSERQLRTLADQLLAVQESERRQIARDLHDSLGSSLSALKYKMEDLIHNLPDQDLQQIGETIGSLVPAIQEIIGETRRMQYDLRPPLLDDLGILPTLTWSSREFQKIFTQMAIEQRLEVQEKDVPELLKVVIYRIFQEALNNIVKDHVNSPPSGSTQFTPFGR